MLEWIFDFAAAAADEMRMPMVIVFGALWVLVLFVNAVVYQLPRLLDHSVHGPSHLPLIGSLAGVIALLFAPVATLPLRLLALPLALLPDLLGVFVYWLVVRLWPDEAFRPPEDEAP